MHDAIGLCASAPSEQMDLQRRAQPGWYSPKDCWLPFATTRAMHVPLSTRWVGQPRPGSLPLAKVSSPAYKKRATESPTTSTHLLRSRSCAAIDGSSRHGLVVAPACHDQPISRWRSMGPSCIHSPRNSSAAQCETCIGIPASLRAAPRDAREKGDKKRTGREQSRGDSALRSLSS